MAFVFVPQAAASPCVHFQTTAVLQGRILDQNAAVVPRARISAQNTATGLGRTVEADSEGNYQIAAPPVGNYRVKVRATGFRTEFLESLRIEARAHRHSGLSFRSRRDHANNRCDASLERNFCQIFNTRFPTGDSGSSTQLQLALRLMF